MNDNELFELCKEVYKRFPEWETGEWTNDSGDYVNPASDLIEAGIHFPLYTSDYLLEKLPNQLGRTKDDRRWLTLARGSNDDWIAYYETWRHRVFNQTLADTPLKALLKLVIALDESGVKLNA